MLRQFITFDQQFGELFLAIHKAKIFSDSKTIVDLIPKEKPEKIIAEFKSQKITNTQDLKSFVEKFFEIPTAKSSDFISDTSQSVTAHCERLWPYLMRSADKNIPGSSLLALPNKYIVPGGRFSEIYYWDSYFTMLGLLKTGHLDIVEAMVNNFCHLIDEIGFIPNGNRTYFHTRSQPPFFSLMVDLLITAKEDDSLWKNYLPYLEKEYSFWMRGKKDLNDNAQYHVVKIDTNTFLNRYYSYSDTPREESYAEDVELTEHLPNKEKNQIYRELRAACESGWDFSARWLSDPMDLSSIHALNLIPVDLNVLLYLLEKNLAKGFMHFDKTKGKYYADAASNRKDAINTFCWSDAHSYYGDYNFEEKKFSSFKSLAMIFPLFAEISSKEQASYTAKIIENDFLKEGGLVTTLIESGQQWDAPNGWAPLQNIAVVGLENYGYTELANRIKSRWLQLNESVFKATGKMLEKYNVDNPSGSVGGGEYPVQDGFGWTNGVYLDLKT